MSVVVVYGFRLISCPASRRRFGWLVCSPAGGDNEREHAGAAVTVSRPAAAYLRAFSRCHCHTHIYALARMHKLSFSSQSHWTAA
uniref:Uncharacterized protein n=1 Tax=Oryza barthii TaxID=65489 RepID=A0A0D3HLR2_9ORYZ